MRRLRHWARVMRKGFPSAPVIAGYVVLVVGGSVAITFSWGRRHLLWGAVLLLGMIITIILEGSYAESRRIEEEQEEELARTRGDHQAQLAELRAKHQATVNAALLAAATEDKARRPDPDDWNAYCDNTNPEGTPLLFVLNHRLANPAAILAFSNFRCTVIDPSGVTAMATSRNIHRMGVGLVAQYEPRIFSGAPPARNGDYTFTWDGLDAKGTWYEIKRGHWDVTGRPADQPARSVIQGS